MVVNFIYVIHRTFTPIPGISRIAVFFYGISEKLFKN